MAVVTTRKEHGTYIKRSWSARIGKRSPRRIAAVEVELTPEEIDGITEVLVDAVVRLEAEDEL